MKIITAISLLLAVFLTTTETALALGQAPNFPSCANPQGSLKVRYESGSHAVIGYSESFSGEDEVYWVEGGIALQCLCPSSGDGIQTNWWNVPGISQQEIDRYKSLGWHFVPTGRDWGLLDDPYLAKNESFSCKSGGEGGGGIGGGSSSSVLGLASTGDNTLYIGLVCLGLSLISGGLLLRSPLRGRKH